MPSATTGWKRCCPCSAPEARGSGFMYIIAIGWIWVVFMMSITETSIVAGLMTFVFYGFLPCALLLYLMGTPARRRRKARLRALADAAAEASSSEPTAVHEPR